MIKSDRALRRNDNGLFRYYRSLVANEIRKAKLSFYDNNICPIRKSCPKAWWKQINKIIGKKKFKANNSEPCHLLLDGR